MVEEHMLANTLLQPWHFFLHSAISRTQLKYIFFSCRQQQWGNQWCVIEVNILHTDQKVTRCLILIDVTWPPHLRTRCTHGAGLSCRKPPVGWMSVGSSITTRLQRWYVSCLSAVRPCRWLRVNSGSKKRRLQLSTWKTSQPASSLKTGVHVMDNNYRWTISHQGWEICHTGFVNSVIYL